MSVLDEYNRLKKKRLGLTDDEDKSNGGSSVTSVLSEYNRLKAERLAREGKEEDIAPVISPSTSTKEEEEEDESGWFKSGAFDDGYQFGDGVSSVLSTVGDVGVNALKGVGGLVEGVTDLILYGVSGVSDLVGADSFADDVKRLAQQQSVNDALSGVEKLVDKNSFLGDRSDAVSQGIGQVAGIIATGGIGASAGLSAAATTALTTGLMGASSFGSGMGEAYQSGASDEEALAYGAMKGVIDAGTELIFGGLGKTVKALGLSKGISSLDDVFAKKLSSKISDQFWNNAAEFGVKASAEGVEEVLAGYGSAVAKHLTYMSEEDLNKLIEDENLLDQFVVGALTSGITQSGIVPGMKGGSLLEANQTGRDFITGLSTNEQKVVDKIYEERIAEESEKGDVSKKRKSEIYDEVLNEMEKGYFSTDTIDEMFGGDAYKEYKAYKDNVDNKDALRKEYETLYNTKIGNKSDAEVDRQAELKKLLDDIEDGTTFKNLQSKLRDEVFGTINGSRLVNSYVDSENRKKQYADDATKQTNKYAKATIENAIKSGVVNNSNRAHEMTETLTKISSDQSVIIDFVNDKIIEEQGRKKQVKATKTFTADGTTTEFSLDTKRMDSSLKPVVKVGNTVVENYTVDYETGKIVFDSAPKKGKITVDYGAFGKINGWVEQLEDGTKKITLNMDSNEVWQFTTGHEITHRLEGTKKYSKFREVLYQYAKDKGDYDGLMESVKGRYEEGTDYDSEVTADLVGRYLFQDEGFVKHLSVNHRNVFQWLWDEVKHLSKMVTAGSKEARQLEKVKHAFEEAYRAGGKAQTGTQYSVNEDFSKLIDKWDGKTTGFSFVVGKTSVALQEAGMPQKQIRWDASKISTLLNKHDGMTMDVVKQIPNLLEEPIVVIDSKKGSNSKIVMGDLYDKNGKIVTAVLLLTPTSKKGNVLDFIKISSAEGRGHIKSLFVNEDGTNVPVRYVDKKRIQSWLNANRLQLPLHNLDLDSNSIIAENSEKSSGNKQFSISDSDGNQAPTPNPDIRYSIGDGREAEVVNGIAVAPNVAETMKSSEYKKPSDYMIQYSVSTEPAWEKNYVALHHDEKDIEVVNAIRTFTEKMVQDDAIRGYVPMGDYKYTKTGPLRSNMEYIYTFDMDTSCPRTFQFLNFRDAIQRKAGRYLTYNESINLLELMRAYGQQIPCCYCYVENKRVLLSASYNNFFGFRNAVMNAKTDEDAAKVMYGYSEKKGLPEASRKALERWRSNLDYNPSLTEVWTATNTARNSVLNYLDNQMAQGNINAKTAESKLNQMILDEFGIEDKGAITEIQTFVKDWAYDTLAKIPHVYNIDNDTSVSVVDERALALNHEALAYSKSASSAKSVENYTPYTDQLKNVSKEDREYIMGMGGIRKHSSNDFRMDYVQDYFMFYADLAADKWTGHTYSKSADFVKIFACTNDRINMSVAFYEDADGNLRENIDEGASWKDVRELRKAYKNVGSMAMVTSDNQLSYALNADWVDMIIPFHASGLDKSVWYNLRMWNDYTTKQSERFYNADTMKQRLAEAGVEVPKGASSSEVKTLFEDTFKIKHIYGEKGEIVKPHFFPGDTYVNGQLVPGHHNDVESYFRLCEEYGVHPRFYGIKVKDANGNEIDVTEHPSYLKLIKETSRTDSAQEVIEFNFGNYDPYLKMTPFEYAMKRLQEEAQNGGFENTKEDPYGVVSEFVNEYLDKDRPLGYLTERAKETRDILLEMSKESAAQQAAIMEKEVNAFSISKWDDQPTKYGNFATPMSEVRYEAPTEEEGAPVREVAEETTTPAPVAPVQAELPDEYNSLLREKADLERRIMEAATDGNENEAQLATEYKALTERINQIEADESAMQSDRLASLTDEDAPPEMEAPYVEPQKPMKPSDPFYDRDIKEVGNRKVKAYMYENPEVKPFFQNEAASMLGDLQRTIKGERWYIDDLYYQSNGEYGWGGVKRHTTDDIAYLLDEFGYTYAEIEKGLNAIIEDNGAENNAVSKRIEFMLDERLRKGYTGVFGEPIPANQDYINLLNEKQILEYSDEARMNFMEHAEDYMPPATEDDIAPIPTQSVGVEETAPTFDATPKKGVAEGQQALWEEPDTKEAKVIRAINKINRELEAEKVALTTEYNQQKESIKDKDAYISNLATNLYNEIRGLKKGVRASKQLGALLDLGYDWKSLKTALLNVKWHPNQAVNTNPDLPSSTVESIVRETLNEEYENQVYGLDEQYQSRLNKLESDAEEQRTSARKEGERETRKALHARIVEDVKSVFKADGFDFDQVLKKAKNLSTFATVDNTPQRVMEKALGYKEGQVLSELTVNKVAQNETEGIKWLNSFTDRKNGVLAQMSKQYGIKPGSKESAAAQMYAEGYYVTETGKDGEYVKGKSEIIKYGDAELAKDFPDANVRENIKKLARDPRIRQIYDETLAAINESRKRNAYPEIPRLENYYLHFRAMEDTFSRLGLPFNPNDIRAKDLPTDLNGVTADLKPGQPYFASAMHRTGKRTSFDLLGGMERYLSSAKNQIYHIDDIQTLRALRNYIADTFGQANGLSNIDSMTEEEAQERIEEVYKSHLSTFAKFLNEEANILAGKTALIDRGFEGILGRRGITFLDTINKQVGSNMVGFNLSSSLTNFLPVVQTFAKSNKAAFVKAFAQTVSNKVNSIYGKSDGFAENSSVIIRRKGADRFYRTPYQKIGDVGYVFMSAVDDISTELIARTKYNEFIKNGMSEQQAHYETDKWVSRLMGDRSLGQMPQLYNSKMLGLVTKFQLEVRNQLDSQFYDTIQEAKEANENIQDKSARNAKTAAKVASTFFQLAVAQHLFGMAFESVAGYNPAFDIIDAIIKTFGWDDEEDSEDTALDNIEQGFLTLLEDMPYASTFMDGGRIPISSALPIGELIKGEDQYGMEKSRWETLGEIAPYYVLPGGYGQIKKSAQGLAMFDDDLPTSGSYTDSGNLRFPVEDTFGNRLQAGIFGQWANENARDYFDNERSPLNEKQTQEYIDLEMPIRDYWEYREGLKKQETLEDKFDYIAGLDVSVKQKNIMINNVVDRAEEVDMSNYDDFGSFEEFDFYTKNTEKYNFLQENNVSYSEYMESDDSKQKYDSIYSWVNNYPDKVTVSKAVTDNVIEYRGYISALYDIKADKDENGKSITGSRKDKVIDYVNNLDIDYGARLILYKSEYPSDDTYNYDIINYLEENDAISGEEMRTILNELGFRVSDDGTISWD